MKTVIFAGQDGDVTLERLPENEIKKRVNNRYYGSVTIIMGANSIDERLSKRKTKMIPLDEQEQFLIII